MEKWRGKIAVVTGGSSGIGAAIVEKFIKHKITTIILDLNEPAEKSSEFCHFYKFDISSLDSIKKVFKLIEEKFKVVNILINNAGILHSFKLLDVSEDSSAKIIQQVNVNFLGIVHCAREALRIMQKSNDYGMIINTCSISGLSNRYPPTTSIYGPTKHAVRSFSEILRQELALIENEKIRVTNLCPGPVKTNIYASSSIDLNKVHATFPNALNPSDIADGIEYVLSTPYTINVSEITIRSLCEKC